MQNRIIKLFGIEYPIIQAGMVWASGWRLASAVSNAGGLGLIGAGSMHPDILQEHIIKCQKSTDKPFGVNVPMLYPEIEKIMSIIVDSGVKIVFTSAGNPKTWTSYLKEKGITVVHVVSSVKFALKAQDRAIKAEENFRYYLLTGKALSSKLTMRQIIGLRFASDEEFVALADKAVKENLSEKEIKKSIKSWKADTYRV